MPPNLSAAGSFIAHQHAAHHTNLAQAAAAHHQAAAASLHHSLAAVVTYCGWRLEIQIREKTQKGRIPQPTAMSREATKYTSI